MGKIHNKKRNVGIVYELLLRHISRGIVENDLSMVRKSAQIIRRHFRPGTELHREFRLFNAMIKTTASSDVVARTIISEARSLSRESDPDVLDREKSLLIRSINHHLSDPAFYHQRIPEYRMYATIQVLLNDWRRPDRADIVRLAEYEGKVHGWLLQEKSETDLDQLAHTDSNSLVVKIMSEKLDSRYGQVLNEEQKEIVRKYVMMSHKGDRDNLVKFLTEIRERTMKDLDTFLGTVNNPILNEKADQVRKDIRGISLERIDDDVVSKFLTVSRLKAELLEDDR